MKYRARIPALIGISVGIAFLPVRAQDVKRPSAAVRESASVSLVEVPVVVHDGEGQPVRGLAPADFEVRDDGKEVAVQSVDIEEFAAVSAPAREPAPPHASIHPAARRRFLLLFDVSFSTPS